MREGRVCPEEVKSLMASGASVTLGRCELSSPWKDKVLVLP